ncbi:MAG TPA: hypothetical protein VFI78_06285 [Salinimicrobium sp.]|nr:hypothetical protein [Salinimicrobium sp.]
MIFFTKILKIASLLVIMILLNSCAYGYRTINPKSLEYNSNASDNGVYFEYKYDLLHKNYSKKEEKKDIRLVAVKVTNNSGRDLVFGSDIKLIYDDGTGLILLDNEKTYRKLKQKPAIYLLYLPLALVNINSFPVGLVIGPGLAGTNFIIASSANKNFKEELNKYWIKGKVIDNGETSFGLIGVRSDNYDVIKIRVEKNNKVVFH